MRIRPRIVIFIKLRSCSTVFQWKRGFPSFGGFANLYGLPRSKGLDPREQKRQEWWRNNKGKQGKQGKQGNQGKQGKQGRTRSIETRASLLTLQGSSFRHSLAGIRQL